MKLIRGVIRPERVEPVRQALEAIGVPGVTVTEVRGHGHQKGRPALYRGREYEVSLLPKTEVTIVVDDGRVDEVVRTMIDTARTGEVGDGRVFIHPVEASYHVRSGSRD